MGLLLMTCVLAEMVATHGCLSPVARGSLWSAATRLGRGGCRSLLARAIVGVRESILQRSRVCCCSYWKYPSLSLCDAVHEELNL